MVSAEESGEVGDEGHGKAQKQNKDNQGMEGKCILLSLLVEIASLMTHARVSCCIRKHCPQLTKGNAACFSLHLPQVPLYPSLHPQQYLDYSEEP